MDNFAFVSFALSMHDPFAGRLVWGSAGLAVAILLAALVGIALQALRHNTMTTIHEKMPLSPADDWRDAA